MTMHKKDFLKLALLFVLCFNFLYLAQFSIPSINGPDGFYHIKIADIMKEDFVIDEFPWMQHSILSNYADLMFLYHILLIPFTFLGLELGAKLSAVLFSTLLICAAYLILRKLNIKYAFLWSLLLLGSAGFFIYRLSLANAVPLSILFSFLGIYFMIKRKQKSLFILSFLYAWLYTFAPILLVFAAINSAIIFARKKRLELKLPITCLAGLALGFIVHPYFPRNIYLWYVQTIKIALFPAEYVTLGMEWLPYSGSEILTYFAIPVIMLAAGFVLMLSAKKRENSTIMMFIISCLFFLLTFKSRRYGEYFVPFTWLFFALAFSSLKKACKKAASRKFFIAAASVIVIALLLFSLKEVLVRTKADEQPLNIYRYKDCALWLSDNTEKGEIILSPWDAFGPLFFCNTKDYYVNGLDPTFLYFYDSELYFHYIDVFAGRSNDLSRFNASYVVSQSQIKGFEEVFSTDFCRVLKPISQESQVQSLAD